jgi:hypothetical protein
LQPEATTLLFAGLGSQQDTVHFTLRQNTISQLHACKLQKKNSKSDIFIRQIAQKNHSSISVIVFIDAH